MAQDRKRDRHAHRRYAIDRPFVGVDGEGGNFDTGHEYMLLRAGNRVLETGKPLSWHDCLPFLADLPKDVIYVAYFFDYDATMILRGLPEERVRRLLDIDCRRIPQKPCSSWPIDFHEFQIDYLPRKELRVRRKGGQWTIISDVGPFFQSAFCSEDADGKLYGALPRWFPEPEYEPVLRKIAEGKKQRHDFGGVTEYEREYNLLEIKMLENLMERFRDVCSQLDIRPQKWQGPGNLVSAVFKREGLPRNKDISLFEQYPTVARMGNDAYYGGRFEVSHFGHIDGPIYQYDINSAYAATYRQLPCLVHGTWRRLPTNARLPEGTLYLADVTFKHDRSFHWGTLPIRTRNGILVWPREGRGTYWSPELDTARAHGIQLTVHGGWEYIRHCDCRWFDFVEDAYYERIKLGKDGKGQVLKLFLASTYGKLAQSVGCAPYSNPVWAGLIVSSVRAQLINACLSVKHGLHVLMLATDGLFTTHPIESLSLGSNLGEWELTEHADIFIVQSGVYFVGGKKPKTRGIPQSKVIEHASDFRTAWVHYLATDELVPVTVELSSFVGLRLAMARNKPELAGQWLTNPKQISFDWHSKRAGITRMGDAVVTNMLQGSPDMHSQAYTRQIGGLNAKLALDLADQPDWGDQL